MSDTFSIINQAGGTESELSESFSLLPQQFYAARRGAWNSEPLRRLMSAMLVDAVRCFQTKFEARQPARRQEFAEVRSWIFADSDDGPFSFTAVCDALEVDADGLRRGLTRWEERRVAGEKPRIIRRHTVTAKRISA